MSDVSTTKISNTVYRAQIKLNEEEFNKLFQIAQDKVKSTVSLPGFRKGKVPNHLILQKFMPKVQAEMDLLSIDFAVKEVERKTQQRIYEVEKIEELNLDNKNRTLTLIYEVFPYVKLAKLKKGYLREYEHASLEEEVQASLRYNLSEFAEYQAKNIGDPIQEDDVITVEYETLVDGIPVTEAKEVTVDLKDFLIDEFELLKEKLLKNPKLAEQEIVIDLPEKKEKEKKQLIFTVKKIQKKILPNLTDEFVKDKFSQFGLKTVKDLEKFFTEVVTRNFTLSAQEYSVLEAIKRLTEESEFFIPESAIDREIVNILSKIGKSKVTKEEFHKIKNDLKPTVEKQIMHSLTVQSLLQMAQEKNYLNKEILHQKLNFYLKMEQSITEDLTNILLGFIAGYYDEKYPAFFFYLLEDLKKVVFSILYEFLSKEAGVKKGDKKTLKEIILLKKSLSL